MSKVESQQIIGLRELILLLYSTINNQGDHDVEHIIISVITFIFCESFSPTHPYNSERDLTQL